MSLPAEERSRPRPGRRAAGVVGVALAVLALPGVAHALVDGPKAGSVSASTLKLPDGPGSIHGLAQQPTFDVFSGQVTYGVPFELPVGPVDFGPALSLTYSGELGNGPVGVGWGLSGIAIRRSVRRGVPSYSAADEIELTGIGKSGRLVPLGDELRVEGAPTTTRVVKKGGGYEVTDRDGTRYLMGLTSEAREASPDGSKVSGWLVQWIVRFGQTIEFRYVHNEARAYLSEIIWGPGQRFHATLTYEDRPDPTISFRTGYQVLTLRRLTKVTVTVSGQTLCSYTLDYDDLLPLSRLRSVIEKGTDNTTAAPELSLEYATPGEPKATPIPGLEGWMLNARGTSFADVDGDGMADLLRLELGNHAYRKNIGGSFEGAKPLTGGGHIDLEASQMMDLDGDARADLVHIVDDTWRAYKLEGERWTFLKEWPGTKLVPLHAADAVLGDINGDGRPDVIQGETGGISVRLSGDDGLRPKLRVGRIDPSNISVEPGNKDVRFTDVNGDGLVDAVWLAEEWFKIYLGRGDGTFLPYKRAFYPWKNIPGADGVFRSSDIHISDLNRDGLFDLVVINAANVLYFQGRAELGTFSTLRRLERPEGVVYDAVVTLTDANGNGSYDVVWSSTRGLWILDLAGGTTAGMLATIHNGLGATTNITYSYSAILSVEAEKAGRVWERKLPVSVPVPTRLEVDSGGDSPARVTTYNVRDGFWDGVERRFGGFLESHSAVSGPSGRGVLFEDRRYHVGLGTDRVLRGMVWHSQTTDGLGRVFRSEKADWVACKVADTSDDPLLRRAATTASTSFVEDGGPPIQITSTFDLDEQCRTVVERHAGTTPAGDEKIVRRTYDDDTGTWVRDRVCQETVLEWDDATIRSDTRTSYGDAGSQLAPCTGHLGNGWVRQVDVHLLYAPMSGGASADEGTVSQRQVAYDSLGNPIQVTEGGVTRNLVYDNDSFYPLTESVQPAMGATLAWHMTWDHLRGQPSTMTDPAGDVTTVGYDALSRPTGLSLNGAAPHVSYAYDWTAPRPRTTTTLIDHAPPSGCAPASRLTTAISNGLGEPLFTSTPLSAGRSIISGWKERDERGKIVIAAEPFYATTPTPAARAMDARVQTFAYDALGRVTLQTLPNGARRTVSFTGLCQTVSSDELADVTSCEDGLGRTHHTERVVGTPPGTANPGITLRETVDARYDAADRIVAMVLQAGMPNETTHAFAYDTWGRLREATDPDTGHRALQYDATGLLRQHTNGTGQDVFFDYDLAGRLTRRGPLQTPDPAGDYVYTYDDPAAAKEPGCHVASRLATVVEQTAGEVKLCYDAFGRQNGVARTIVAPGGSRTASFDSTIAPSGLLLSEQFDDGFEVDYCYDAAGRANEVKSGGTTLWSAAGANDLDASGRVVSEVYGNGATEAYTYDSLGLTKTVSLRSTVGGQLVDLFKIDVTERTAYGAPKKVEDLDHNPDSLDHNATYAYDTAARLTRATLGSGSDLPHQYAFTFKYDGLQNMTFRQVTQGSMPKDIGVLTGAYKYGERGYGPRQLTSVIPGAAP